MTTLLTPLAHDREPPHANSTLILTEALCASLRPESILTWLRNPDLRHVLSRIANGQLPLTHEAFDAEPVGTRIEHLRSLLIHHGLLPERDQYLFRFEAWLDDKFKAIADSEIRRPVEQFARWHHLRRIRSLSQEGRPTRASIISSKQEIIEATRFLTWLLHTCARTAEECTQADIDTWLADGTATRRAAKPFIRWAVKNRICGPISPGRHITKTVPMLTQDQRLEWLKRCLISEIDTLAYRVAAVLVLLYGQPLARIVRMRTTDIVPIPAGPRLSFGQTDSIPVPEPFAALLKRYLAARPHLQTGAKADNSWLFPGSRPGQHLLVQTLNKRLRYLGIDLMAARNSALRNLVTEAPPPLVAEMLGYSYQITQIHADQAAEQWSRYAAPVRC